MKEELDEELMEEYDYLLNTLERIVYPAINKYKQMKLCKVKSIGTVYNDNIIRLEFFSRILFGISPLLRINKDQELIEFIQDEIKDGVNPDSTGYWGKVQNYDQRIAEMVPIALAFYFNNGILWESLNQQDKSNISKWLYEINTVRIRSNNWLCFIVLINTILKKLGCKYNDSKLETSLKKIKNLYLGNGWFKDGAHGQSDYYNSFAFHYYLLIFVRIEPENIYAEEIKATSMKFAETYKLFQASDGSYIPYGRSLIYRFAQSAYWGALVFSGVNNIDYSHAKWAIINNCKWWTDKEIYTEEGMFNLGYEYENLFMTESYNSSYSPYWALKSFVILYLSKEHDFWKSKAKRSDIPKHYVIRDTNMIICNYKDNELAMLFPTPLGESHVTHNEAKYYKFVYSNKFSFGVTKSSLELKDCNFDSALSISDNGFHYRTRSQILNSQIYNDYIKSTWSPFKGVKIDSYILPGIPWHVRVHKISTDKELSFFEGGFSVNDNSLDNDVNRLEVISESNRLFVKSSGLESGIIPMFGDFKLKVHKNPPNTHISFKHSITPAIEGKLPKGNHVIGCLVFGDISNSLNGKCVREPIYTIKNKEIIDVMLDEKRVEININNYRIISKNKFKFIQRKIIKKIKKIILEA